MRRPSSIDSVFELAPVMPAGVLAVFACNPLDNHQRELENTGLFKMLQSVQLPERFRQELEGGMGMLAAQTQVGVADWKTALSNGFAIGWTGFYGDNASFIAVARLGTTVETFDAALSRLTTAVEAESLGTAEVEMWRETRVWEILYADESTMAFALHGDLLVVANTRRMVEETLARVESDQADSLMHDPSYVAFVEELDSEQVPLFGYYLRPGKILNLATRFVPADEVDNYRQMVDGLNLDDVDRATCTFHIADGEIKERVRISFPSTKSGLLSTLVGRPGRIEPWLAELIPADVAGFSFGTVEPSRIAEDVLVLLREMQPELGRSIDESLERLKSRSEVDVREFLSTVGDRFVTMSWADSGTRFAALVELRDAIRFQHGWDGLRDVMPLPVTTISLDGRKAYQVMLPRFDELKPVMTSAGGYVVFADSETTLAKVLDQIQMANPQPNERASALLGELPGEATYASWTDLEASVSQLVATAASAIDGIAPEQMKLLAPDVLKHLGALRVTLIRDADGFLISGSSPVGSVQGIAVLTAATSIALPAMVAQPTPEPVLDGRLAGLRMLTVAEAEQQFRTEVTHDADGDGHGEYGTLTDLLRTGHLQSEQLGTASSMDGIFTADGYMVGLIVPEQVDDRERRFVAVAWPAEKKLGPVYCAMPRRGVLVNDILAATAGIATIDLRDVFVGGEFGSDLTAGWREWGPQQEIDPTVATTEDNSEALVLLVAAEAAGHNADVSQLVTLLQSNDATIAARAAWLLGNIKATDAVPELSLLLSGSEPTVRVQAISALQKIGSRQSLRTAIDALEDDDVRVRALAAATLGKLRSPDAIDPLLDLVSRRGDKSSSTQHSDVVAALLALNDIGRPDCLLAAASVVKTAHPEVGNSLAFLYQSLSPTMDREDEVTTLLAVLDHADPVLRRYAIQRLGELKEPTTARALEGRLAVEDAALQPLVRVSLAAVRGETSPTAQDFWERTKTVATSVWKKARARWDKMTPDQRNLAMGGAGGVLLILLVLMAVRSRRKRRRRGDDLAAMVAPSEDFQDGYTEEQPYEGAYGYAEDGEYAEGEYAEGEGYAEEGAYDEQAFPQQGMPHPAYNDSERPSIYQDR